MVALAPPTFDVVSAERDRPADVLRPVQFLGSKLRVLDVLVDAIAEHAPDGAVLDVFTGSTVVAQALARGGRRVVATDALAQCALFARALLAVGAEPPALEADLIEELLCRRSTAHDAWTEWDARERDALARRDGAALLELGRTLPQAWRPERADAHLARVLQRQVPGAPSPGGVCAAHYAGTYFGVRQATAIDALLESIADERTSGRIDAWQEAALLTALLSAASECVFSAGKHYAQPHNTRADKDDAFLRVRILADRGKDLPALFAQRCQDVGRTAQLAGAGHDAAQRTLEQTLAAGPGDSRLAAIYADPPYAAQQYSRFYHVPEVLLSGRVPRLQRVRGEVTKGIYAEGRFKSRFCSRVHASAALQDLLALGRAHDAPVFLSYAAATGDETGNERSIALPELRRLLGASSARVIERELAIEYRQFNSTRNAVPTRRDVELLFVIEPHA